MPINTLEFARITQTQLDKQVVAEATSGWMELNSSRVKYSGGNEVKIPKLSMDGLGNYDRDNGFVQGSVTLEWETKKLTQDRGRTFQLDAMDVDETAFVATAASVMGEFQRTRVIPEIDAYRYSSIATQAIDKGKATESYTPDASDILTKLREDIYKIYDVAGEIPLVISMSMQVAAILEGSKEIAKVLDTGDFKRGDISTKVRTLDGVPIMKVPSARMQTKFVFYDGKTSGEPDQTKGGFKADESAKAINWIIQARDTAIAVSKTDKIRVFNPDTNQKADAWKLDYRKYHDLWIIGDLLAIYNENGRARLKLGNDGGQFILSIYDEDENLRIKLGDHGGAYAFAIYDRRGNPAIYMDEDGNIVVAGRIKTHDETIVGSNLVVGENTSSGRIDFAGMINSSEGSIEVVDHKMILRADYIDLVGNVNINGTQVDL